PDRLRKMPRIEAHAKFELIAAVEGNVNIMRSHPLTRRDTEPDGIPVPLAPADRTGQDDNVLEIAFVGLLACPERTTVEQLRFEAVLVFDVSGMARDAHRRRQFAEAVQGGNDNPLLQSLDRLRIQPQQRA